MGDSSQATVNFIIFCMFTPKIRILMFNIMKQICCCRCQRKNNSMEADERKSLLEKQPEISTNSSKYWTNFSLQCKNNCTFNQILRFIVPAFTYLRCSKRRHLKVCKNRINYALGEENERWNIYLYIISIDCSLKETEKVEMGFQKKKTRIFFNDK